MSCLHLVIVDFTPTPLPLHPLCLCLSLPGLEKGRTHQGGNKRQVHFYSFWKLTLISPQLENRCTHSPLYNTPHSGGWIPDLHQIKFLDHLKGLRKFASVCPDRPDGHEEFPLEHFCYLHISGLLIMLQVFDCTKLKYTPKKSILLYLMDAIHGCL